MDSIRQTLRTLYVEDSRAAHAFRYSLVVFDVLILIYIVGSSFLSREPWIEVMDFVIGIGAALECVMRLWAAESARKELFRFQTAIDFVVVISLLAPLTGQNLAFLRAVRVANAPATYPSLRWLSADATRLGKNPAALKAGVNLILYLFLMTGLIYEAQSAINGRIQNYGDALFFVVSGLTTTGFGDLAPAGTFGRVLSVIVMILGVTLFLQLVSAIFGSQRVLWRCRECGLMEHEGDANHCRQCGTALHRSHA